MKIKSTIILSFFIVALLGSVGGVGYYYINSVSVTNDAVFNHLESLAQSRADHIQTFLEGHEQTTAVFSESTTFKEALENPENNLIILKANKRAESIISAQNEILKISIIDKTGKVIVSSDGSSLDTNKMETLEVLSNEGVFIKNAHISKGFGVICMDYGLPIFDDERNLIGGIIIDLNLEDLNEILVDKTGIGASGETYLINSELYPITPLLFVEYAEFEWKVDTSNSNHCFENHDPLNHNKARIFEGYRGKTVLGTHIYIPEMNWCLLAEVDDSEALGPQRRIFLKVSITIILIIVILVTLVGLHVGRVIEKKTGKGKK